MTDILILDEAEEELSSAVAFYEARSSGLGIDFLREIEHGLNALRHQPCLWPVREDGTRRYLLHRFPYVVVYRFYEDAIWILAFAHCRRKPGYWTKRLP